MGTFHTAPIRLMHGENSQAFFAFDRPADLIVFIHGFKGAAMSTWDDFAELVTGDSAFKNTDIVFYGYGSLRASAAFNAESFRQFLDTFQQPAANGHLPASQGLSERSYHRIFIVAHSLGALISRQALLNALRDKNPWTDRASLILFAPAHMGARVQSLVREVSSGWFSLIGAFMEYKYPVYEDLEYNSVFLTTLISETEKHIQKNEARCLIAKRVVWAQEDCVVRQVNFCSDPNPVLIPGKGHIDVCKPGVGYVKPIEILKSVLM